MNTKTKFSIGDKVIIKELPTRVKHYPVWRTIGKIGKITEISGNKDPYHVQVDGSIYRFSENELAFPSKLDKILS